MNTPTRFRSGLSCFVLLTAPFWMKDAALASLEPANPETSIYGGVEAESCEWPTAIGFGSCSGTLVHPNIVLYAAHCGKQRKISFGDAYKKMHRTVKPKFCKTNPEYSGNGKLGKGVDFAYCYLEEPITDFPTTPVAYGCELEQIKAGTKIWLVGFGNTDKGVYGVKHKVETEIGGLIANGNELKVGGSGKATCNGDSGGPGYVKMSDGTWRHVAISSYGFGECGQPSGMTFSKAAVPWVHKTLKEAGITDVDITPCYNDKGEWEPTEQCKGFATEPGKAHGSWGDQCGGDKAPRSGYSSICGPAAGDDGKDNEAPEVSILSPEEGSEIEFGEDIVVKVKATDDGDKISVTLKVDDKAQKVLDEPPYQWTLEELEEGEHTLVAVADDGNKKTETEVLSFEVVKGGGSGDDTNGGEGGESGEDSGGGEEDSEGGDSEGGDDDSGGGEDDSGRSGGEESNDPGQEGEHGSKKKGCSLTEASSPLGGGLLMLLAGLGLRRRRRR